MHKNSSTNMNTMLVFASELHILMRYCSRAMASMLCSMSRSPTRSFHKIQTISIFLLLLFPFLSFPTEKGKPILQWLISIAFIVKVSCWVEDLFAACFPIVLFYMFDNCNHRFFCFAVIFFLFNNNYVVKKRCIALALKLCYTSPNLKSKRNTVKILDNKSL